ncbi:MAG: mandelate racemase/muconate lactonizing enzyme family protein [Candidatus Njordarchaeales archaeon]
MLSVQNVLSNLESAIKEAGVDEKISSIKAYFCVLNYYKPFEIATSRTEQDRVLLVEIETETTRGFGESSIPASISRENLMETLTHLGPGLKEKNLSDALRSIIETLPERPYRLAFSIAILDAIARLLGKNFGELFAPVTTPEVFTDITIGIEPLEETLKDVTKALEMGFKSIKLKVGKGGVEVDFERIKAVADMLPSEVSLRIDANQGWTYQEAREIIPRIDKLPANIEFIEQPLPRDRIDEINELRKLTELPIIVDESFRKSSDLENVLGKVDGINLKIAKAGDPIDVFVSGRNAKEHGLLVMIGCAGETNIGITVDSYLASVIPVDFADLDSDLLKEDILKQPVTRFENSKRILPMRKGLGITDEDINEEKLSLIYSI